MPLTRRALLATASATLLTPRVARAATLADDAGRSVTVPDKVRRVFPAGPAAAILLYTLAPELLLGWPRANTAEQCAYMLANICRRPDLAGLNGRDGSPDAQNLKALEPDLILGVGATGAREAAFADRLQQQSGIPYALLDGRVLSLSTSYEKLGRLTGRTADGADFADYCNQTLGVITNRIAFVPREQRPRVYLARGPAGLSTGLGGAIDVELVELLARNVAGAEQGGSADVTLDHIRQWQPDAIIASDPLFVSGLRDNSAWTSLKAVRDGRVYLAPRLPFGWIDSPPSANRLIGLWWLAKSLYPEHFKEDLREVTQDFYTKFYHTTPTTEQITRLLAGKE